MIQNDKLYPLKFHPIFKERIWGGTKLNSLLDKPGNSSTVGESWELSAVEGSVSIVANGSLKGLSLEGILKKYQHFLVGEKVYQQFGEKFPLLLKFIDAQKDLSIQVHPNDILAKKRHNSFGKTEMWYVVQADEGSHLIVDFKEKISKKEYQNILENGQLETVLNYEPITKGDSYFINAGKIHAIGKGALIAEIQQSCDITYRVYDWKRTDNEGNTRELHTELALDAIDFSCKKDFKLQYEQELNGVNNLVSSSYFTTNFVHVKRNDLSRDYTTQDSFKVLMCVEGEGSIQTDFGNEELKLGETVLIPAMIPKLTITTKTEIKLLEVYI